MAGCARRERRQLGHALASGWFAENFARTKALKPLEHYLHQLEPEKPRAAAQIADEAAAAWAGLADRGLVKIRERKREAPCPDNR